MQLAREKRGPRQKNGRSKWFKIILRRLQRRWEPFFSRHKLQEFLPGKSRKCKKMQHTREKRPFTKKMQKKIQKNATTLKKIYAKRPKMQKKCVGIFSPLYFGIGLASFWGRFGVVLASFWDHFGPFLAPVGPFLTFWGPFLMVIFGCFWTIFGIFWVILGRFWTIFGSIRSRFGVT